MGVASWLLILSGPFVGSGPVGVLLLRKGGWLLLWFLAFGGGGRVWLVAWCWHRRHACCCSVVGWWWVPLVRACVRVGGGMLSGFWGSAPWLPGPCSASLFVGGGVWVWVGWL